MEEYCKHEAAILYALRDKNSRIIQSSVEQSNLPQLLGKCSLDQLVEIILEHAKEDKSFGNYLKMKLSDSSDPNSIISDFKGHSDIEDVLKAGELVIDKTEKLNSSIDKIRVYAEIITMLEDDIEDACNSGYDEESWELFEVIDDCSSYMETAVTEILNSENQADISSAWNALLILRKPAIRRNITWSIWTADWQKSKNGGCREVFCH